MIISFAWTSGALVSGAKTRTRRDWKTSHAQRFNKDMLAYAWDKSPRFGGKMIAIIRLTEQPFKQLTSYMREEDFALEGFKFMHERGQKLRGKKDLIQYFNDWIAKNELLWVVDFKLVSLTEAGEQLKASLVA